MKSLGRAYKPLGFTGFLLGFTRILVGICWVSGVKWEELSKRSLAAGVDVDCYFGVGVGQSCGFCLLIMFLLIS